MAKIKAPLLGFQAQGRLGKDVTLRRRGHVTIAEAHPTPTDPRTQPQVYQRDAFTYCITQWHTLTPAQKEAYRLLAPTSNYNAAYINFMKECLAMAVAPHHETHEFGGSDVVAANAARLRDLLLALAAPSDGQVLTWNEAAGEWQATTPAVGEGHITLLPHSYSAIIQGTWAPVDLADQWARWPLVNTSGNNGDEIHWQAYLDKGTYRLCLLTITGDSGGIVDVNIDAAEVASFDLYSAVQIENVRRVKIDIAVATAGLKTIKLKIDGKNPSSSNYSIAISYVSLWRTA